MRWVIAATTGNMNGEDQVVASGYHSETEVDDAVRQLRAHGKPDVRNADLRSWAEEDGRYVKGTWRQH